MCQIIKEPNTNGETEGKVYGVLTDYSIKADHVKTSQRIGTPPYMAQELLTGACDTHLCRHNVESLFYVMLLMCMHHQFDRSKEARWPVVMQEGKPLDEARFNERSYIKFGNNDASFFADSEAIELSPAFRSFRGWLLRLWKPFGYGFTAKQYHGQQRIFFPEMDQLGETCDESASAPFDDETLRGLLNNSSIIEPVRRQGGELKGLAIRLDPALASLTSAGETQTDN